MQGTLNFQLVCCKSEEVLVVLVAFMCWLPGFRLAVVSLSSHPLFAIGLPDSSWVELFVSVNELG